MKGSILGLMILAAAPVVASADTISQTVQFDYSPLEGVTFPVIQGFDTMGGTRALTGVTFEFRHNFTIDLFVESTGPTALQAGDYSLNLAYMSLYQVGLANDGANPPFFGPGAFFIDNFSVDLAAYDGIAGNDGPDSARRTFTDAYTNAQTYGLEDPSMLAALTDVGALTTVYGGFGELGFWWINDPNWPTPDDGVPDYPTDAALWVHMSNFRHSGEIVLTYDYVMVPGPMSVLPLAGLALVARRRRA